MEYLLDTNILIDWFAEGPSQKFLLQRVKHESCQLSTSWICAAEFLVKAGRKEERALFQLFEAEELRLYDVGGSDTLAQVAGLRRTLSLPLPDCIILATAIRTRATLLSRDEMLCKKAKRVYPNIICPE